MEKLILIGAGGHCKVIQDIVHEIQDLKLYAIIDDAFGQVEENSGVIHANRTYLEKLIVDEFKFCITVGDNIVRKNIFNKLNIPIERYTNLIHPRAVISRSARIGYGTVVMANTVVNADTVIGSHAIINTGAVVEHDNIITDYVHISPNVTLSGGVGVGEGSHLGSGATVIPGKNIGNWSVIGAGGVVVNDMASNVTAVGVPAQVVK